MNALRTVDVLQYLKPLREGGSLPGLVRADDDFLYVMKFRGAGQGSKALVAEIIGGLLAQAIGLRLPELVFMNLDDSFSRLEPDEEIQDLLTFSVGLNLGLHFLSSAITFDPLVSPVDGLTASKTVLLDSMILNIDRTVKNTNLLMWNHELWLIDHGASLYFHHNWPNWQDYLDRQFVQVKDHVLLDKATELNQAAQEIKQQLSEQKIMDIVDQVPTPWLSDASSGLTDDQIRAAYIQFLTTKLQNIDSLAQFAQDAR